MDGTVLVVRPEKNRRKLVFRAVESLLEMDIHLFGIVANCIQSESGKGYSFGEQDGYGYGYGYGDSDAEDSYGEGDDGANINFESKATQKTDNVAVNSQDTPVVPRRVA